MKEKYIDYISNYETIVEYLTTMLNVTEGEIDLVTDINGINEETFNDIIYVRSSYRDIYQLAECEDKGKFYEDLRT